MPTFVVCVGFFVSVCCWLEKDAGDLLDLLSCHCPVMIKSFIRCRSDLRGFFVSLCCWLEKDAGDLLDLLSCHCPAMIKSFIRCRSDLRGVFCVFVLLVGEGCG